MDCKAESSSCLEKVLCVALSLSTTSLKLRRAVASVLRRLMALADVNAIAELGKAVQTRRAAELKKLFKHRCPVPSPATHTHSL